MTITIEELPADYSIDAIPDKYARWVPMFTHTIADYSIYPACGSESATIGSMAKSKAAVTEWILSTIFDRLGQCNQFVDFYNDSDAYKVLTVKKDTRFRYAVRFVSFPNHYLQHGSYRQFQENPEHHGLGEKSEYYVCRSVADPRVDAWNNDASEENRVMIVAVLVTDDYVEGAQGAMLNTAEPDDTQMFTIHSDPNARPAFQVEVTTGTNIDDPSANILKQIEAYENLNISLDAAIENAEVELGDVINGDGLKPFDSMNPLHGVDCVSPVVKNLASCNAKHIALVDRLNHLITLLQIGE